MSDKESKNKGEDALGFTQASGVERLEIYRYQADIIQNALRITANVLGSHKRETCLDRDVMQSWNIIDAVLRRDIEPVVSRFSGNDSLLATGKGFLHSHPKLESDKGMNADHVIVDRGDWERARDILSEPSIALAVAEIVKRRLHDHKDLLEG